MIIYVFPHRYVTETSAAVVEEEDKEKENTQTFAAAKGMDWMASIISLFGGGGPIEPVTHVHTYTHKRTHFQTEPMS